MIVRMSSAPSDWLETCVATLTLGQPQRVWSVVVSLFGDLAQNDGDRISGALLQKIVEAAGIRPEAMRVALHRLRKDGWLESQREGRESYHYLSAFGRAQSAGVTPRIYATSVNLAADWHFLIALEGDAGTRAALDQFLLSPDYTPLAGGLALGAGPVPAACDGLLAVSAQTLSVPGWIHDSVCPPSLVAAAGSLEQALVAVAGLLSSGGRPGPLARATLRTLIVHAWRRVLLRHADLPDAFFPPDWRGPACRVLVAQLLDQLPRPELAALEAAARQPA